MRTNSTRIRSGVWLAILVALSLGHSVRANPSLSLPSHPRQENQVQYVLMTTTMGDIVLELNGKKAPITVENFLGYVDDGFYEGTIFHRVMENFMIQGGGLTESLDRKETNSAIKNEYSNGLLNTRGTVAMARTNHPDSATSQFFINVKDNAGLDQPSPQTGGAGYCVFGKVVVGMKVVDAIRKVDTMRRGQHLNVPIRPIEIKKIKRVDEARASELMQAEKDAGSDDG